MFATGQKQFLLQLARDSIRYGLDHGRPLPMDIGTCEQTFRQQRACFVTLHLNNQLRGCIGSLEATRPLVIDVAENAYAAAFRDPRFPALVDHEFGDISIDISVLTPAEPMEFSSQRDLLAQLRPDVDGLILQSGRHRATFLPAVWQQLPEPSIFLKHLMSKAGLDPEGWPDEVTIHRYQSESFSEG